MKRPLLFTLCLFIASAFAGCQKGSDGSGIVGTDGDFEELNRNIEFDSKPDFDKR